MALDSGSALSIGLVLVESYDDKAANLRQSLLHNTELPEEQLLRALRYFKSQWSQKDKKLSKKRLQGLAYLATPGTSTGIKCQRFHQSKAHPFSSK